jgi:hypothetical protein
MIAQYNRRIKELAVQDEAEAGWNAGESDAFLHFKGGETRKIIDVTGDYGIKIQTFCNAMWPGTPIWNRDVDKSVSRRLLTSVASMTATAISRAEQTLLRSLRRCCRKRRQ